jgi:hypothetical protein
LSQAEVLDHKGEIMIIPKTRPSRQRYGSRQGRMININGRRGKTFIFRQMKKKFS